MQEPDRSFGVSVLRNLSFIMDAKGCRTGLIISTSGFSKVVIEQTARLAYQEKYVLLIDGDDLDTIAAGMHPSDLVNAKYHAMQKEVEDDPDCCTERFSTGRTLFYLIRKTPTPTW